MRSLFALLSLPLIVFAQDIPLPVPRVQVLPLPHSISRFQLDGNELTSVHADRADMRPFCYPILTSQGVSLVRMGHPYDPVSHSHHNGVWVTHNVINGIDFWGDHAKVQGRIENQQADGYEDGDDRAYMLMLNHWIKGEDSSVQMIEARRIEVRPIDGAKSWLMLIDLQWTAPKGKPVTIGQSFFGPVGVRMAKTIGVRDGGGRLMNSEGALGEDAIFHKPARWVDYTGRITNAADGIAGIALMDDPRNVQHGAAYHVRTDGWMGSCTSSAGDVVIQPEAPLRLRYGLWVHDGAPTREQCEAQWQAFAKLELATFDKPKAKSAK
jgi:hypothetical protein